MTKTYHTSELNRLAQCLGSLKLADTVEARYPASSTTKEEGEAAHWLAQAVFNREFTLEEMNDRRAPNGYYVTPEMSAHVEQYLNVINTEPTHEFAAVNVPTSFLLGDGITISGKADHISAMDNQLRVDAFHYGYRIVPAVGNWSLIAHAIGYCFENGWFPDTITLTVHQPRAYRPSGVPHQITLTYDELMRKHEELHRRLTGSGDTCATGPSCTICPLAHGCSAFNSASMNTLDVTEMVLPVEPKGDDLSLLLDMFTRAEEVIKARLKSLKQTAEHEVASGAAVPNWSLERKSGALRWNDGMTPELVEMLTGHDVTKDDKPPMITPTQAKKLFKLPDAVVDAIAHRPETAPQLVRVSANDAAVRVFGKAVG